MDNIENGIDPLCFESLSNQSSLLVCPDEAQITNIQPGRLSVVCIQATNIARKDMVQSKTMLNLFVKFTLGQKSKSSLVIRTKNHTCMSQSALFDNENLSFDVQDPSDFLSENSDDIKLKIEVFDDVVLKSSIVGEVTISALRFFSGKVRNEWIPLRQKADTSSNSLINLKFRYMPVSEGILMITATKGIELRLPKTHSPSRMYFAFNIGSTSTRESQIIEESSNPTLSSEVIYLNVNKDNWFNKMITNLIHVTANSKDTIGEHKLDIIPWMNQLSTPTTGLELPLHMIRDVKQNVGKLCLNVKFLHSSVMTIKVIKVKPLDGFDQWFQTINPYFVFKSDGRASCLTHRTVTMKEEEITPVWNEEFEFSVVDHRELSIECFDDNFLTDDTQDDKVGLGTVSLLTAYRTGHVYKWITLSRPNEFGGEIPWGQVQIELHFKDVGYEFPRLHESTQRVSKFLKHDAPNFQNDCPSQVIDHDKIQAKVFTSEEFSDEEIRSSFDFLDLDKNGYIGAGELRHVLINMGELITDEEVDTMISMLDKNGDGQVNFHQFEAMAKSSNVEQDFKKSNYCKDETNLKSSTDTWTEIKQRQTQFLEFIVSNNIDKGIVFNLRDNILMRYRTFMIDKDENSEKYSLLWKVNYNEFCELLRVNPTGETFQIFNLFDHDNNDVVDVRELTISLCNFIGSFTVQEKCSISFELFDRNQDYINADDLKIILASTHLKHPSELTRKVQTILKFVDKDGTNKVSEDLLCKAAMKFPNLFLPNIIS